MQTTVPLHGTFSARRLPRSVQKRDRIEVRFGAIDRTPRSSVRATKRLMFGSEQFGFIRASRYRVQNQGGSHLTGVEPAPSHQATGEPRSCSKQANKPKVKASGRGGERRGTFRAPIPANSHPRAADSQGGRVPPEQGARADGRDGQGATVIPCYRAIGTLPATACAMRA
jgi:hypothetical protein